MQWLQTVEFSSPPATDYLRLCLTELEEHRRRLVKIMRLLRQYCRQQPHKEPIRCLMSVPGIGFVLAVTGWWFILWLWVPLYADMLRQLFFTPLLGILGAQGPALWFSETSLGLFVTAIIMCVLVAVYITIGMKWYSRIQKWCFWISIVALAIVLLFLLFGNNVRFQAGLNTQAPEMFNAAENVYDKTVVAGQEAGAIAPLFGGTLGVIFLPSPTSSSLTCGLTGGRHCMARYAARPTLSATSGAWAGR